MVEINPVLIRQSKLVDERRKKLLKKNGCQFFSNQKSINNNWKKVIEISPIIIY